MYRDITLIGPQIRNDNHHVLEKCIVCYEYPEYTLAEFSEFFRMLLKNDPNLKTIDISTVCSAEEFHAFNIILQKKYNLVNLCDYFLACFRLIEYTMSYDISKILVNIIESHLIKNEFNLLMCIIIFDNWGLKTINLKFFCKVFSRQPKDKRDPLIKLMSESLYDSFASFIINSCRIVVK